MTLSLTLFLAATLAAPPAAPETDTPPTAAQVRESVERSLVFLEKSGMDWWNKSKCASCHHVPMTMWSLSEAKNHGFSINDKSLEQLRDGAIPSYSDHPKLRPVGQDGNDAGASMNTIYLTQAATSSPTSWMKKTTGEQSRKKFHRSLARHTRSRRNVGRRTGNCRRWKTSP